MSPRPCAGVVLWGAAMCAPCHADDHGVGTAVGRRVRDEPCGSTRATGAGAAARRVAAEHGCVLFGHQAGDLGHVVLGDGPRGPHSQTCEARSPRLACGWTGGICGGRARVRGLGWRRRRLYPRRPTTRRVPARPRYRYAPSCTRAAQPRRTPAPSGVDETAPGRPFATWNGRFVPPPRCSAPTPAVAGRPGSLPGGRGRRRRGWRLASRIGTGSDGSATDGPHADAGRVGTAADVAGTAPLFRNPRTQHSLLRHASQAARPCAGPARARVHCSLQQGLSDPRRAAKFGRAARERTGATIGTELTQRFGRGLASCRMVDVGGGGWVARGFLVAALSRSATGWLPSWFRPIATSPAGGFCVSTLRLPRHAWSSGVRGCAGKAVCKVSGR